MYMPGLSRALTRLKSPAVARALLLAAAANAPFYAKCGFARADEACYAKYLQLASVPSHASL